MLHNTAQKLLRTLRMPAVREVLLKTAGFLALFCMARAELSQGFSPFCAAVSAGAWMAGAPPILLFGALCGAAGSDMKRPSSLLLALLGLAVCHMIGVGQFALVTGNPLGASAFAVSVPYIAKDVLSVLLAAAVVRAAGQRLRPSSAAAGRAVQGQIGHLS